MSKADPPMFLPDALQAEARELYERWVGPDRDEEARGRLVDWVNYHCPDAVRFDLVDGRVCGFKNHRPSPDRLTFRPREEMIAVSTQKPIDWGAQPELLNRLLMEVRMRIEEVMRRPLFGCMWGNLIRYHRQDYGITVEVGDEGQCVRIDITPVPAIDSEPSEIPQLRRQCQHRRWEWRGALRDPKGDEELDMRRYCLECGDDLEPEWEMVRQHRPYDPCGYSTCLQCTIEEER